MYNVHNITKIYEKYTKKMRSGVPPQAVSPPTFRTAYLDLLMPPQGGG